MSDKQKRIEQLELWLKRANAYLHKAVADGELGGCMLPVKVMAARIDKVLAAK